MDDMHGTRAAPGPQPEPGEADHVYPVHTLDDNKLYRKLILTCVMRFNDILDPGVLNAALSSLLETGDWRKLGGRLRLNAKARLEIHVPREYTAQRPAVNFTHQDFLHLKVEEHRLAKQLSPPTRVDRPSVQPISPELRAFVASSQLPSNVDELVGQDTPQLFLHVISFQNATLVTISWPHTLMDAAGLQALLRAWSLTLASREKEVPPLLGARKDVLDETVDEVGDARKQQRLLVEDRRLTGWTLTWFLVRFLFWNRLFAPEAGLRAVYIPRETFARLRARVEDEVKQAAPDGKDAFVSDGDILTAWFTRIVTMSKSYTQPVTILSFANAKYRLPEVLDAQGVFVQNMVTSGYTFLSDRLAGSSLGAIALSHRHQLGQQTTEEQTRAFLRQMRREIETTHNANLMYADKTSLPVIINNRTKNKIVQTVDFGAAVSQPAEGPGHSPGTMTNHFVFASLNDKKSPDFLTVLGKDHQESYWLQVFANPHTWSVIEEQLRSM